VVNDILLEVGVFVRVYVLYAFTVKFLFVVVLVLAVSLKVSTGDFSNS